MRHTCIAFLLVSAAVLIAIVNFARSPRLPAVTLALQSVSLTNDAQPVAIFEVTNGGHKTVFLSFDGKDYQDERGWQSVSIPVVGIFGSTSVSPGTNCTVSIRGPLRRGPWRIRATVFESASLLEKIRFAGRQVWMRVSGKAGITKVWLADLKSPAYKICSPEVPDLPRSSFASDEPLIIADESIFWQWDGSSQADETAALAMPPLAQPPAAPNDGPAASVENIDTFGGGRHR